MNNLNHCSYRTNMAIFKALWCMIFIILKVLVIWSQLVLHLG